LWDEPQTIRVVRFGTFELDLAAGELCKKGLKVRLQDQPFQLLAALAARPGEVVTREELKDKLWPSDTYVDFDRSLNTAASKLRDALGDSASSPRFIETLPRRGYRFLASVETVGEAADRDESSGVAADAPRDGRESTSHEFEQRQRFLCFALAVTAAVAIVAVGLLVFQWLDQPSATGAAQVFVHAAREAQPTGALVCLARRRVAQRQTCRPRGGRCANAVGPRPGQRAGA